MDEIFRRIVTWFAPILCFTMEEAWLSRFPEDESVHLETFFAVPAAWANPGADREMEAHPRVAPRRDRRAGTGARRQEDRLQPGGRAHAAMSPTDDDADILRSIPFDEVAITSGVTDRRPAIRSAGAFMLPDVKGVAVVANLSAMARNAPAAGGCCRKSAATRTIRDLCDRCDRRPGAAPA